ncbi:MAG: PAS domain S-box protein, partial [Chloroflexi bacterium]|nr:PAS domain S-box protein [Chloroflexota bacterium]
DLQGNMVDVSQVACDSLGYSREELLKLFIWELVPVMPVGGSTEWKDLALDVTLTDEVHVQRKDGTTFPVEGRARKFELRGQELMFVVARDISARKRAEGALAKQSAELAEMATFPDMNPGPVCRLDRDGTIVLANKAARQVFDDERLLGKNWLEICPGMDQKMWQQILQAPGPMTKEVRLGERAFIFTLTSGAEGQYVFVYGTDVTEQQAAERALAQGQKMATLGTLAAGVAHELNNPAAAAQRGAEQLRDAFGQLQQSYLQLEQVSLSDAQVAVLKELDRLARERAAHPVDLDAIGRSDREYELETWLDDRGVDNSWELAPALVDLGYDPGGLSELADRFEAAQAPIILTWLSFTYPVYSLLTEIGQGAGRVSEIVNALKEYSYLGSAPSGAYQLGRSQPATAPKQARRAASRS